MPVEIFTTSDGSHSLLNTDLNEAYHSVHGAIQESTHVFINNGLQFFCERSTGEIRIFEMGFGTGLNAFLTALHGKLINRPVHYTAAEVFPLEEAVWSRLNYGDDASMKNLFQKFHHAQWSKEESLSAGFTLLKLKTAMQETSFAPNSFDVVYYDAFAPSKQPELWDISMMKKVTQAMKPGAVFVTYSAKGQLKRDLAGLNLKVEILPGPPGKKEMTRALKI